jgi:DNA-directed RNA polymerase
MANGPLAAAAPSPSPERAAGSAPANARERELQLERDSFDRAIDRYRRAAGDTHRLKHAAVARHFANLAGAVLAEQDAICQPGAKASRLPKYAAPLLAIDADRLAVMTLHTLFAMTGVAVGSATKSKSVANEGAKFTAAAREVGRLCQRLWVQDGAAGRRRDVAKLLEPRYASRARSRAMEQASSLEKDWAAEARDLHLGAFLIHLAASSTGAFEVVSKNERAASRPKTTAVVQPTQLARHEVAEELARDESQILPVRRPMVCPPVPWKGLWGGGYLTDAALKRGMPLVKHRDRPAMVAALKTTSKSGGLAQVLRAVNALQNTSWRINRTVYDVMRRACGEGGGEAFEARRRRLKLEHVKARLEQCADFVGEERLYFPYSLDYRGRAYCVPEGLHPQGDDPARALLEFGVGKALGDRGEFWLKVHLSNLYGRSGKGTLAERVRWAEEHTPQILASAAAPHAERFWTTAKKPWSFLRTCGEWDAARRGGAGHISHLPVSVDGTCNGFQHLSALSRDGRCGRNVNLLPADAPQDIYERVAERVRAKLHADASEPQEPAPAGSGPSGADRVLAEQWLLHEDRIDREFVKSATMTTPYGATRRGIAKKLEGRWGEVVGRKHAWYMARVLEESIADLVRGPKGVMRWLRAITRTLAANGHGVRWCTPAGFPVVMEERQPRRVRVVFDFGKRAGKKPAGRRELLLHHYDPDAPISPGAQLRRVVPNYVHSLDAAHLILTVEALLGRGLDHFLVVHDSFGVHAADMDVLGEALRTTFVKMYASPLLAQFLADQKARAGGDVDAAAWGEIEAPPQGDLDLSDVLRSTYFFS